MYKVTALALKNRLQKRPFFKLQAPSRDLSLRVITNKIV